MNSGRKSVTYAKSVILSHRMETDIWGQSTVAAWLTWSPNIQYGQFFGSKLLYPLNGMVGRFSYRLIYTRESLDKDRCGQRDGGVRTTLKEGSC